VTYVEITMLLAARKLGILSFAFVLSSDLKSAPEGMSY
jgi:hypothetical protein